MAPDEKYYYKKPTTDYTARNQPQIIKWHPLYSVEIDEDIDHRQYISFYLDKFKQDDVEKPKSNQFEKVKPIIKEVFINYYSLALKFIHETQIEDGEFYFVEHSKSWFQIAYFSSDSKNKISIKIDFRDSIESLWIMLDCSASHKNRLSVKKDSVAIPREKFMQFLNSTIQFLLDSDSYLIFIDDYIRIFYQLAQSDKLIEGFIITAEKHIEKITSQLISRKENIEKRLIENDNDTLLERTKLRGELDGIIFALKTIQINT